MHKQFGKCSAPFLILHGGAGAQDPTNGGVAPATVALKQIAKTAIGLLLQTDNLLQVAAFCLKQMEDDPQFNAGLGSALQSDGVARLSAALMMGHKQRFSGVAGATFTQNPSQLAIALQSRKARVLMQPGTELLARELLLPIQSNLTTKRLERFVQKSAEAHYAVTDLPHPEGSDTVGCVIINTQGEMVSASSTGGRGFEYPGRMSDTPTIAGTYASRFAAIAATGHGEQIMDDAVAARLETRVRDGLGLESACLKTLTEAQEHKSRYGWIALDQSGAWAVCTTTDNMPFVVISGETLVTS
jgi:L-asparaginase